MNVTQTGRSMVEMLGTLAIIGVLSVGGIAGYSKAMFKYKLNKHAEQMNMIFNSIIKHSKSFSNMASNGSVTKYFIALNEIPKEMYSSTSRFKDAFGLSYYIYLYKSVEQLALFVDGKAAKKGDAQNFEICKNFFTVAQANHENISFIESQNLAADGETKDWGNIYSGKSCKNKSSCLNNLTVSQIHSQCTKLTEGSRGWQLQVRFF